GYTSGMGVTRAETSPRPPTSRTGCGHYWTRTATTPGYAWLCTRSTRTRSPANWRPSPAATPPCTSARRGGSLTPPRCCGASARRSPRPPASITLPASSTTPEPSAPSRCATTCLAGSTPAFSPGSSPNTGSPWTRRLRPLWTFPIGCRGGSSAWTSAATSLTEPDDEGASDEHAHHHHRRRGARRPLPDRGGRGRLRRDQPRRLLRELRRVAHRFPGRAR